MNYLIAVVMVVLGLACSFICYCVWHDGSSRADDDISWAKLGWAVVLYGLSALFCVMAAWSWTATHS